MEYRLKKRSEGSEQVRSRVRQCSVCGEGSETFVDVIGYRGHYSVGNHGTVITKKTGRVKVPSKKNGYDFVWLHKNNTSKQEYIHRLVAKHFLTSKKGTVVDHRDRIRTNNCPKNLRWITQGANIQNSKTRVSLSGVKGVTWSKQKDKWHARIKYKHKTIHLGFFSENKDAEKAYHLAAQKYYPT